MPSDRGFRSLLLEIEDELSDSERKRFVFLLSNDIPRKIRDGPLVDVFTVLIDRGHISETDCSYLLNIFEDMKLLAVAYKIAQFQSQNSTAPLTQPILENFQRIENISLPEDNNSLALEVINDFFNNTDSMLLIPDSESNSPTDTPILNEPSPEIISLSVENIDLNTFERETWSDEFLQKINVSNIRPYEYQRELVQSAIQARNTIICLRTGGKKTFVAGLLLKYYLIKNKTSKNEKKFLAFFIVPHRAMLKQQMHKLKQIGNLRVAVCDETNEAIQYVHTSDVIVCTPRKLLYCLRFRTIFLTNIDVLCFDECDDNVIRNQYIEIMQYLLCKNIDQIPSVESSPIIIGLTAIGVRHMNSSQIIQNLANLCATFNCLTITTVSKKENEEELERCVTRISEDEIICVEKQKEYEALKLSIEKDLKDLILQLFINKNTNPLQIFPEKDMNTNGYEQNLILIKESEQKKQHFPAVLLLDYSLVIYRHLQALMILTPQMVLSDLKDQFETIYKSREHPTQIDTSIYDKCHSVFKKKLAEIQESEQILKSPKLEKLVELLKSHAEKPNSRVLILVERTFYTKKICDFLQNHSDLKNIIKPCCLVGHTGSIARQVNRNQSTTLEGFQTGVYNVMIATDVIQAGLNIPQCSLVVRYDFVPDNLGTVQARIRARAVDCRYCLITTKDSANYNKEKDSRQYERDLSEVLETWKGISLDEFQHRVQKVQESLVSEWNNNLQRIAMLQKSSTKTTELTGDVLCGACDFVLGPLSQLRRHGDAYFLNNRDFYNCVEEKLFAKPEVYTKSTTTGKAHCGSKKCRVKLGNIQILRDYPELSPVYPLKCEAIKIKYIEKTSGKEEIIMKKKWSKMPFNIPHLIEESSPHDDDNTDIFYDAYIPRVLQEETSIGSALDVLQKLFDSLKISSKNVAYLVRALEAIQRHDCAQRLLDYDKLVPKEIRQFTPLEEEQNSIRTIVTSRLPTEEEVLQDLEDVDTICLPAEAKSTPSIRFAPPEPDPMDFASIDLRPFEDSSYEWTTDYSQTLGLNEHPRNYQIEIIRDAIRHKQTIVCLRTGSGKTFIASVLIKYYFIKKQKEQPNSTFLALFFVPRKAIRLQQAKAVSEIGNLRVQLCDDDQTIDQLMQTNHVIVATPQKFVNCLNKETMRLSQLDMIIFDECHNTSGGNPYCEIMKYYLCPLRKQNTSERPLIIGLTATVSAKDAVEKKETIEKNLVTICSKLACRTISTVCDQKNIDEINAKISRPSNDQFEFVKEVIYNSYFEEYSKMFKDLIEQIKQHLDGRELLDEQEIGSSSFIGQLILLKRTFETKDDINNIIICDYLLLLTKKYSALKDLPFDMVIKHVMLKIDEYHQGYQRPVPMDNILYERCGTELNMILEKYAEHAATNPKLDCLVELLKRHASQSTKGLILVKTTFYAKTIYDYLSNHPELINFVKPAWIVGQNSADHALTIHDQETKLKEFCGVERNEGLNIPTCSYVIRYEFVSDEIGTIQSRGRARAKNSSYYLITEHDSINHHREKNNKIREDNMEAAIAAWPNLNKDQFHHDVESHTKTLIKGWEDALRSEEQQRNILRSVGKKEGSIHCRRCGRLLGQLAWLKKRNTTYFINNPEFFTTNDCRLDKTFTSFQENLVMGDVKCTCGNSLGGCLKFMDRSELGPLCALKCKQIKFKINDQPAMIEFGQWSKNDRFDVEELQEI
ncbi:hypothetical protein I4U23_026725 [Adineta vaga]|nr:hypothetical protein I4U23_026725 [Adineta vaga]